REIGIRVALGADRGLVLRLVLGQSMRLTLLGIGIGLAAALSLSRAFESVLYRVAATDPPTYGAVPLVLLLASLLASLLPARRALAIAPYAALKRD
ncbi:MAG TPA: FtsX-like permease family protein, partial [Vicinamibacteria bacterium]